METKKATARTLIQQGQFNQAKAVYLDICTAHPQDLEAWIQLAAIHGMQGHYQESISCSKHALEIDPHSASSYFNISSCHLAIGDLESAEKNCNNTLELQPNHARAANMLAHICSTQGRFSDAIPYYKLAITNEPALYTAHLQLGSAFSEQGLYPDALESYQRASKLAPTDPESYTHVAILFYLIGDLEQSIKWYEKAIKRAPSDLTLHCQIGDVFVHAGKLDEAMANFCIAERLDPSCAAAIAGKAEVHEHRGEYELAFKLTQPLFNRGVLNAKAAIVYERLSSHCNCKDDALTFLLNTLRSTDLSNDEKNALNYALGRAYAARHMYSESFSAYQAANNLEKTHFNKKQYLQNCDRQIKTYTRDFLKKSARSTLQTSNLIFIVGMPRSGTTLVEQILATHEDVFAGGELPFLQKILSTLPPEVNAIPYPEFIANMNSASLDRITQNYLDDIQTLSPDAHFITDKMWAHYEQLGLIALLFPQARIIHCKRNPMDTCLSNYFQHFGVRVEAANDLDNLGFFYQQYERLMKHWQTTLELPIFDLQYEELVSNQESISRQLIEFCGLKWDKRCLEFYNTKRDPGTASYDQVNKPVYTKSIGRWKPYEPYLGPLIAALNAGHTEINAQ